MAIKGPFDPAAAARAQAGAIQNAFQTQRASGQPGPTAGVMPRPAGGGGFFNKVADSPIGREIEGVMQQKFGNFGGGPKPVTAPVMPPAAGPPAVAPTAPAAAPPPQTIATPAPPPGAQLAAPAAPQPMPGLVSQ